jgi:hypothetical protein
MHLKTDKPLVTIYSCHKPHPTKVANTALSETTKADEIVIKTAKTGKVTVVVAVMSIFSEKRCKLWSAKCGNEKPFCQKVKKRRFSGGKYPRIKKPFSEIKKRPDTKVIST